MNLSTGPSEQKTLMSGLHVVCDVFCKGCTTIVGWKYVNNLIIILFKIKAHEYS